MPKSKQFADLDDQTLVRYAIVKSRLSATRFGTRVMARSDRTIRSWLAGDNPVPSDARRWLLAYLTGRVRVEGSYLDADGTVP